MLPIIIAISIAAILFVMRAATIWMRYDTFKLRLKSKGNYSAPQPDNLSHDINKSLDDIDQMIKKHLPAIPPLPPLPSLPPFTHTGNFTPPSSKSFTVVGYGGGGSSGASTGASSSHGGGAGGAGQTAGTWSVYNVGQQSFTFPTQTSVFYKKRGTLQTLLELQVPKSTWIRHYILGTKGEDDPKWKEDFLAFCKENDLDIDEKDLEKGALLI